MHFFGHFQDSTLCAHPVYAGHSAGYTQAALVDGASGSVHTGLSIEQLAPGGTLEPHVHSYEESFYVLSGQAVVRLGERDYLLTAGDYGLVKVGAPEVPFLQTNVSRQHRFGP